MSGQEGARRVPRALVAGPMTDSLATARNEITHALKEITPLDPGVEPSDAMLRAQGEHLCRAVAALLPVALGIADFLKEGDPVVGVDMESGEKSRQVYQ